MFMGIQLLFDLWARIFDIVWAEFAWYTNDLAECLLVPSAGGHDPDYGSGADHIPT